jgi:hypothetical protein
MGSLCRTPTSLSGCRRPRRAEFGSEQFSPISRENSVPLQVTSGISSNVRPFSSQPVVLFLTPPHCFKKNGIFALAHCRWMLITHSAAIGRAPAPRSPPTMTQLIPASANLPRSSRSGSIERKAITGRASRRWSIRGSPCFRFSRRSRPHPMCGIAAENASFVFKRSRSRSDRLVSTWYVCRGEGVGGTAGCATACSRCRSGGGRAFQPRLIVRRMRFTSSRSRLSCPTTISACPDMPRAMAASSSPRPTRSPCSSTLTR